MLKPHRSVLYVGRSGAGKSEAMKAVLRHVHVDLAVAFCPTDETADELAKCIPRACIHPKLDLAVVERALALQKELAHKERSLALIADDCGYTKGDWSTSTMRQMLMNARHHRIALHFSMQYLKLIEPALRSNVSYVVCCAENILANKKALWQCFFGLIPSYQEFDRIFTACTQDYSCIVLDQTQPSASVENSVFWYKADIDAPPFRMCKPCMWTMHKRQPAPKAEDAVSVLC